MTCIVALRKKNGQLIFGSDAGEFDGWNVAELDEGKVWRSGAFLFGVAGDARDAVAIQYGFKAPKHRKGVTDRAYMSTTFVRGLRDLLREEGRLRKKDDVESMSGIIVVGYRGNLYEVFDDFSVYCVAGGFTAIGAGRPYAKGSLLQTAASLDDEQRVCDALRAAEVFCAAVRGPFFVIGTKDTKARMARGSLVGEGMTAMLQ
jgi:ATP-dependent protease HslVU (ClpYQ) peptidase subunit